MRTRPSSFFEGKSKYAAVSGRHPQISPFFYYSEGLIELGKNDMPTMQVKSRIALRRDTWSKRQAGAMRPVIQTHKLQASDGAIKHQENFRRRIRCGIRELMTCGDCAASGISWT